MFTIIQKYKEVIQKVPDCKIFKCNYCDYENQDRVVLELHIFNLHIPMLIVFKEPSCKFCQKTKELCTCDLDKKEQNIVSSFQPSITEKIKYFKTYNSGDFSIYLYFNSYKDACFFTRFSLFEHSDKFSACQNIITPQWWKFEYKNYEYDYGYRVARSKIYNLQPTKHYLSNIQKQYHNIMNDLKKLEEICKIQPQQL